MNKPLSLLVLLIITIVISNDVFSQSNRRREKYKRSDGKVIYCIVPPPDVLTTSSIRTVDAKIPKLLDILKSGGGVGLTINQQKEIKRFREELSALNIYEVMEYRLCVQTGSNVLTLQEYRLATAELRKPLTATTAKSNSEISQKQENQEERNLVVNSSFEDDFKNWGTGYLETKRRPEKPFWTPTPIVITKTSKTASSFRITDIRGEIESGTKNSGSKSLKIVNNSPLEPNIYGTVSQRITGLSPNSNYLVTFWVKAEGAGSRTLEITCDLEWKNRKTIVAGTYTWQKYTWPFTTGKDSFIDLRIISEEPGTVWIDDVTLIRQPS